MARNKNSAGKVRQDSDSYLRTQMQRDIIIERLKENGCRITKQRLLLLGVILENECSSCKEIYYKASSIDRNIGSATVYRMINKLEEIGAISRKNMYKVACSDKCELEDVCTIELDDSTVYHFSAKSWNSVIKEGLRVCGYLDNQNIQNVIVRQCDCAGEVCK
ncbi:transcriptional repressor [Konateibacter massiliensis]|uniref:transcriptional repressor n=1 Tax=Konateibacter massiliensis TaxID=2002841 RepID=UPI000C153B55|nr:transcriptional repressor [Konateibacter massiliensis]